MMAKRIVTILPKLEFNEALEITKIYSISGKIENNVFITKRPFRSPHYNITKCGMIGGGKIPEPGEISFAHNGVLYVDELPEFKRDVIETLREPLEDKKILINRNHVSYVFPANFMLVASMNPCPCGFFGDKNRECKCTKEQIQRYKNKISGPLLDRIDMHIYVSNIKFENFKEKEESSEVIRKRVNIVRKIQLERYKYLEFYFNSELNSKYIDKFCKLKESSNRILNTYFEKMKLTVRSYTKILKVARTIADLDNSKNIEDEHILEAIQYRSLDKI